MQAIRLGVAGLLLVGFAVLVIFVLRAADDASEIVWTRYVYVLAGVEALVFAAAGWLFGREVHREQAQQQAEQTKEAQQALGDSQQELGTKREEAAREQEKGRALARAVMAHGGGPRPQGRAVEGRGAEAMGAGAASRPGGAPRELAELAESLYPELSGRGG